MTSYATIIGDDIIAGIEAVLGIGYNTVTEVWPDLLLFFWPSL